MINKIERRDGDIEIMRENYLKCYYDEQNNLDDTSLQALGLNMYIKKQNIRLSLYNSFCRSLYDNNVVMHPQQIECLNYLLKGENLLISAPTSFGKTFVALEYISRKKCNNIVFVVPTLALMNELFSKIRKNFGDYYNIVQNGYENINDRNIIIIVPERADVELLSKISSVDLLVFDEIYKLQRTNQRENSRNDDKRIISLNRGYFELVNRSKQVLLLGPFIKDIAFERTQLMENITKYITDYSPVYTKIIFMEEKDEFVYDEIDNDNAKLIYFNDPHSIYEFCVKMLVNVELEDESNSLTNWCDKYITEKWLPSELLKKGIGIHHGKLPGFMRKYIENLYNSNDIYTILCTSTLLEGINTPTSELIVYDSNNLSAFKLNNLIGRVGRLNSFQKGLVYLFDKNLQKYLIGNDKYEEITIVAETNDITDLEEAVYLNKSIDDLDEDNLDLYNRLIEILARYGKTLEDLKNTDGFVIREFIQLFDNLDSILLKADKYIKAEEKEKYLIKNDIIESFVKIIKYTRQYMLVEINNNLPKKKRIKGVVCVSKLLNLKPESIYQRIQKEIKEHQADMDEATLNLFIDYLFDLAFSYIKYDLTRMVRYFDFIFSKEYLENKNNLKDKIAVIESIFLHRLRIYCCDNDLLLKILIDLDLPYRDAKEISKMLVELDKDNISTSIVMDMLEFKYDEILKSKKIDNVSKDLLKILLNK